MSRQQRGIKVEDTETSGQTEKFVYNQWAVWFYTYVYYFFNALSPLGTNSIEEAIAVIAVAPTDRASFVYSYVQTRLYGQYNGKWPFSLVYVLKPLKTAITAIVPLLHQDQVQWSNCITLTKYLSENREPLWCATTRSSSLSLFSSDSLDSMSDICSSRYCRWSLGFYRSSFHLVQV